MSANSTIQLNSGIEMPKLGLGVFRSSPEDTTIAVSAALTAGYRHIDTAAGYFNERSVGAALRDSDVARDDVFLTTKMWVTDYGYDSGLRAFEASRDRLGVDYVDLYLLHWPVPSSFEQTVQAYKAAEQLLADGKVRAIGVCNFQPHHLDQLIQETSVVPSVNQVELHPLFQESAVRAANERHGIVTESWSPIGGVIKATAGTAGSLLEHPVITDIGSRYDKTGAQVVLRWHLEHDFVAIPKSVTPSRIAENFDVFDFALTADEIAAIDALDRGQRVGPDPDQFSADSFQIDVTDQ